ncbi:MAG: DoxX family protein [Terriglobales bacterium]
MASDLIDGMRPLGLTLLRLGLGVTFLYHGMTKLSALGQWQQNFIHMGFPGYFAYVAGTLEAVGGALLVLGLFTRIAGLLLAGELLIALIRVHLPGGPLWQVGRFELPMLLSGTSFLYFCYGAGPISLDRMLGRGSRR